MKRIEKPPMRFKPKEPALRKVWGACLMVDDLAHNGITKASGAVEKTFGVKKKTLAYGSVAATTLLTSAVLSFRPEYALPFAALGSVTFLYLSHLMKKAMELTASAGAAVQNWESVALKAIRLPLLAYSAYKLSHISGGNTDTLQGIYTLGVSVAAYLSTTGNGTIEKAKAWLSEIRDHLIVPEKVPVPVKYDR